MAATRRLTGAPSHAAVYPFGLPSSSPAFPLPRVPNARTRSDCVIGGQRLSPVPGTESVRSYRLAEFLGHPNQLGARRDPELQIGAGNVTLHRPLTDVQPVTDLGRRVGAGGEAGNFQFAPG